MPRQLTGTDRGISLIEMVIAVLILAIGVSAGFQSLAQARRGIGEELPRLMAREVALNRAEEHQILGAAAGLPGVVDMGALSWTVETERAATTGGYVELRLRVFSEGRPGALLTAYAPAEPPL